MLTPGEKVLFLLLALFSAAATLAGLRDMWRIVRRGEGELALDGLPARLRDMLTASLLQRKTLRTRKLTSWLHLGVVWGFSFYALVNLGDLLEGYLPDYHFPAREGLPAELYRLAADLLSVAVLVGVLWFVLRRLLHPWRAELEFPPQVPLHPKVREGAIRRDSRIVAGFILLHVGARFLGDALAVAGEGADLARPFASLAAPLFAGVDAQGAQLLQHFFWWLALGSIALFMPWFPHSKHAHLFMAPLNFLTRPQRRSPGALEPLDFEDETREQFGAGRLEHLQQTQLLDAFACIQCNRCQDVCPATITGKELSPAALEINKRYEIGGQFLALAAGAESERPLPGSVISESALWACTSCGACTEICPVGNEPMHDILDIRRDQVLMEGNFPTELQAAFNGMERQGNPWGAERAERMRWANGLDFPVPTVDENPACELLYWTGCAVGHDPRAALTARALVKLLHAAGVNFAVTGMRENCTGDVARRAGNEYLYEELARGNVETLNELAPPRIVVTCPHCLHNLGSEYPQFGAEYEIVHHTELLAELRAQGRLPQPAARPGTRITFHDPCYLGRHNGVFDAPREALGSLQGELVEMPRNRRDSFCCGAGGAQFWKEEEPGTHTVGAERYAEARASGADIVATGCPFCLQMLESSKGDVDGPVLRDVAELLAEGLPEPVREGNGHGG